MTPQTVRGPSVSSGSYRYRTAASRSARSARQTFRWTSDSSVRSQTQTWRRRAVTRVSPHGMTGRFLSWAFLWRFLQSPETTSCSSSTGNFGYLCEVSNRLLINDRCIFFSFLFPLVRVWVADVRSRGRLTTNTNGDKSPSHDNKEAPTARVPILQLVPLSPCFLPPRLHSAALRWHSQVTNS